jgi:hypothetical protein
MLLAESARPNGGILSQKLIDLAALPLPGGILPRLVGRVVIDRNEDGSENSAVVIRAWRKSLKGEQPSRPRAVAAFGGHEQIISRSASLRCLSKGKPCLSFPLLIAVSRHQVTFV